MGSILGLTRGGAKPRSILRIEALDLMAGVFNALRSRAVDLPFAAQCDSLLSRLREGHQRNIQVVVTIEARI